MDYKYAIISTEDGRLVAEFFTNDQMSGQYLTHVNYQTPKVGPQIPNALIATVRPAVRQPAHYTYVVYDLKTSQAKVIVWQFTDAESLDEKNIESARIISGASTLTQLAYVLDHFIDQPDLKSFQDMKGNWISANDAINLVMS
jgi:hypothetical protein